MTKDPSHWAVILAGGDGRRLQCLTHFVAGDDRPKQFCRLLSGETLLAETTRRVGQIVSPACTMYVVTRRHEAFYRRDLAGVRQSLIVEQPENRGTAVGIAYALARLRQIAQQPIVAFFPADHHYANDVALRRSVVNAFSTAARSDRIMLLGAEACRPETEYGWIQPGDVLKPRSPRRVTNVREVVRFWEKPSPDVAAELLAAGCLWNTFITVGRADAFADLLEETMPDVWRALVKIAAAPSEVSLSEVYDVLPSIDFSHRVLSQTPGRLAVVPLRNPGWTDLGQPKRVIEAMASRGMPHPRLRMTERAS